ncbi:MAG: hypothetical protein LQ352_004138, partial [Teloschistes flavicans]
SEKNRPQQNYNRDTDRYQNNAAGGRNSPYPQPQNQQQQLYSPQQQPPQNANPAGEPQPDPYAAYGGYANYIALWYQSVANQQQQQQQQQPGGPGAGGGGGS